MILCNVIPDAVLFIGLFLGVVIGFKKGFVRVLFSGIFKRIIALICAILLAKPIGRLIGERFLFGGIAGWIEKTLAKAIGDETGSMTGETLERELPRVVRWIVDLLHIDTGAIAENAEGEGAALIRAVSEKIATPVANVFGVVIAAIALYFLFRIAFGLIRTILDKIMNLPGLVIVNRILGIVAGFTFAVLFLWIGLSIYAAVGAHYASDPGFFSGFDLEKTLAAKYLSGTRPLDFVFSIK
ncbi:MAG: hypothetical protein J6X72_00900 [Clostridia bacterium]|nr:hypothetical protein [Clostridia bacterium]